WLLYGGLSHGMAMLVGGTGRLNQTMGAVALLAAPHALQLLTAVPFVSVSSLLLTVWSLLIVYRGVEVAHDLPWKRAMIVAIAPLGLLMLAALVSIALLAAALLVAGAER
ncbi:MAG: YIP1 family protein, partial [Caldilineaceae bacterium]|nr:YIP1 family protein [Caldilineaceae bacterium]